MKKKVHGFTSCDYVTTVDRRPLLYLGFVLSPSAALCVTKRCWFRTAIMMSDVSLSYASRPSQDSLRSDSETHFILLYPGGDQKEP